MKNPKHNRILAIACWAVTLLCVFLTFYMARMAGRYLGMEAFTQFAWALGVLALLWLAGAVWFTVLTRQDKKK